MKISIALLFVLGLGACSTSYKVAKITHFELERPTAEMIAKGRNPPEGIRFHLPKKYVLVEPQSDGSVKAKFVYLPDPDQAFAISSASILQNNALTVTVASGLLTDVSFTQDNAGSANKFVEQLGAIETAKAKAETAAAATATTAAETNLKALNTALATAQLAFDLAELEHQVLVDEYPSPTPEQEAALFKARLAKLKAKETRDAAQRALDAVVGDPLGNLANGGPAIAYGPAFFAVEETASSVTLLPARSWGPDNELQLAVSVGESALVMTPEPVPECLGGKNFLEVFNVSFSTTADGERIVGLDIGWQPAEPFQKATATIKQGDSTWTYTLTQLPWTMPDTVDWPSDASISIEMSGINGDAGCNLSGRRS